MKEEFKKYVDRFNMSEKAIERKYYHSLRVMELAKLIAKYAGFSEEDSKIAEVAGLLHDYGRFPQWTKYKTYNDSASIDHADYSIEKLFYSGEIMKFWSNFRDYDEIFDAIKYHNKLAVPETLSEHNKLLCKVIRDADKLDLLYLSCGTFEYKKCDDEISPKVKESFYKHKQVDNRDKRNSNDVVISRLALVYDFNFKYSFDHLKKYKIIDQMYENISDQGKFKSYFEEIKKYIDNKIEES